MIKKFPFALIVIFSSNFFVYSQSYSIVEDRCGLEIATPSLAERKTRKLRLENGLEALLISDPGTHQSGAAVAVGVGSWDDPKDRPGMAHFVEHMLFLGTEKYPEEEAYTRYLDEYDGSRNAFTMADRTVYMFSINNKGFEGALDRFAQFFISPLFSPSGVERESIAIDQEFLKDVPLDSWRVHYVQKELANPDHPFHQFCIGNKHTLTKISQDELKEWYYQHYSADLMHLVIYSAESLDTLEKQITALFSQVKKVDSMNAKSHLPNPILSAQTAAKMVAISPLQDLQHLELTWELPISYGEDKDVRADELLSHVLGHEGSESLLAQLKKEELAESLAAGTYRAGYRQGMFHISIELTAKGLEKYETVIERCYEAIASFRRQGFPKYLFDEIAQLKTLNYKFQERDDIFKFVTEMASNMVDEPLETFPRKTLMPSTYDPDKVMALLNLMTPDHCHYTLVAPTRASHIKMEHKEKWMGVDYKVLPISTKQLEKWQHAKPHQNISLPSPNPFIPKELSLCHEGECNTAVSLPNPKKLVETESSTLYTCTDDRFLTPEIAWIIHFKTPLVKDADPRSHVLADLYCHTVKERLNAIAYEAEVAGLTYDLEPKHNGIKLTLSGYSEKAPAFLEEILQQARNLHPSQQEFSLYKDLAARDYANSANKTPIAQGVELLWSVLYKHYSGVNEKESALKSISYDSFVNFCRRLYEVNYIEGAFYGNQSDEESLKVWQSLTKLMQGSTYPRSQHPHIELAVLPEEKDPSFIVKASALPGNVLLLTADCGEFSFERRAAHEILTKGLEEPFFTELRTKQQTAYLVANWSKEIERHLYSFFIVQSGSHDTRDLLARFELFFETALQNLSSQVISPERFEAIRDSLITHLEHPAQKMEKMADLLFTLAFDYDGDFKWLDKRIEGLRQLTYEQFINYSKEFLGKTNHRRLAICVNGTQTEQERFRYRRMTTPKKLRNEIQYRSRV